MCCGIMCSSCTDEGSSLGHELIKMMLYFMIFRHTHKSYQVPFDSFITIFMGISCLAQSHWESSFERLTKHTEIIDAVKTNVRAANEQGSVLCHHSPRWISLLLDKIHDIQMVTSFSICSTTFYQPRQSSLPSSSLLPSKLSHS